MRCSVKEYIAKHGSGATAQKHRARMDELTALYRAEKERLAAKYPDYKSTRHYHFVAREERENKR